MPGTEPDPSSGQAHSSTSTGASAQELLTLVLESKSGAEVRSGQLLMSAEVERALRERSHLLVEAGTGTGKSLAYLLPALRHAAADPDNRVVVATATKALQEQLIGSDLPFLAEALEPHGITFRYSMLKGRSNYACLAKADVLLNTTAPVGPELTDLSAWLSTTTTGERSDSDLSEESWSKVALEPDECPGAARCPFGSVCFTERAKARAAASDLVVVNTALYATHLASGGQVLPAHQAVVFDEAHTLEDITASSFGINLTTGRLNRLAASYRSLLSDPRPSDALRRATLGLEVAIDEAGESSLRADAMPLLGVLERIRTAVYDADRQVRLIGDEEKATRVASATTAGESLLQDLGAFVDPSSYDTSVCFAEGRGTRRVLRLVPVDVAPLLASELFSTTTVVATSATLATAGRFDPLARRLGLDRPESDTLVLEELVTPRPPWRSGVVSSPFDYARQGLLYLPDMPGVRDPGFEPALHRELGELVQAAGGRSLALFTSRAAMVRAVEALRNDPDVSAAGLTVLGQDEAPRHLLLDTFRSTQGAVLVATQGFWTGVDLPGDVLTLVTLDKIPFPRPTDPLAVARRERAAKSGQNPFASVDLPRAATLLAQGAGRLIRTRKDSGVVAVFDKRLTHASYATTLLATLPDLKVTHDGKRVRAALSWIDQRAQRA